MIGDIFLNWVYNFLSWIISIFPPSAGFPAEAHAGALYIGGYFGMFSPLIPMGTLLTVITLLFTVEIAIWGFRTFKWLISHLPFIGGRG